jgi:NAD(P)H dehydrogenase (quinone)
MKVLTVFAHNDPRYFCGALLKRFDQSLRDAGHTNEVVDLYAIGFDPALRNRDRPNWIDDSVPDDVLEYMNIKQSPSADDATRRRHLGRAFALGREF